MSLEEELRRIAREEAEKVFKEHRARESSPRRGPAEYLTKPRAAEMAGVSIRVIDKWIREKLVKAYGSGSKQIVKGSDVRRILGAPHVEQPKKRK